MSWQLAKKPTFLFLLMSDFLGWTSIYIPYVHLYERARLTIFLTYTLYINLRTLIIQIIIKKDYSK